MSKAFLALAAGLLPATGLSAAELWPGRGASLALGDVSGMAYYTAEPDGYRVVATLAAGESTTPVRIHHRPAAGREVDCVGPRRSRRA
jgi:hypothetical protein